jgi:hypothetical protein
LRKLNIEGIGRPGSSFYPDVHGSQTLLKYDLSQAGGCAMIRHPRWGTRVYPATLFIRAPFDVIERVVSRDMADFVLEIN